MGRLAAAPPPSGTGDAGLRGEPVLPMPRGELTAELFDALRHGRASSRSPIHDDALGGDDFHLALYCCYELHYRSFADVGADREWDPSVIGFRLGLEQAFVAHLGSRGTAKTNANCRRRRSKINTRARGKSPSLAA